MSLLKDVIYRFRGQVSLEQLRKLGLVYGEKFNPQIPYFLDPSHCWLISIGDNVTFGPNVQVFAHDASTCNFLGYAKIGNVKIGNNVFVGAGSIILPGVSIGNDCVVGAGSVVSQDIPDNMVYAGNPAVCVSTLEEFIKKNENRMKVSHVYGEEYTLRNNISNQMKLQQKQELENRIGFVK